MAELAARAFPLGAELDPGAIAQKLGVSRTTVDRAISTLHNEGWVQLNPNSRPTVLAYPRVRKSESEASNALGFTNQTQRIYQLLLERVFKDEFRMGEAIKAKPLADEMGVSISTVRQALDWLCGDGVLRQIPRRGWQVVRLTTDDIKDIYRVRLPLELQAVERAMSRVNPPDLSNLAQETETLIEKMDRLTEHERCLADYQFHRAIAEATGSAILVETLDPLLKKCLLKSLASVEDEETRQQAFPTHKAILDAILAGDKTEALKQMKLHLQVGLERLHETTIPEEP